MSTALRSVGLLGRTPCIHARLRRLATKPGEKCGLAFLNLGFVDQHYRDVIANRVDTMTLYAF